MRRIIFSALSFYLFSHSAVAADLGLDAASLKLKVYKFAVSTSPLCTNLTTVIDNGSTPSEVDFTNLPNLGSGTIANGTYPCVVVEFSDNIKFTPSAPSDQGNCDPLVEETQDVCRAGMGSTSALVDGSTTTCTNGADRVAMYISTAATSSTGSDAFNPPTSLGDASHGFNLGAALTVSNGGSGKFVVNPSGKVCDGDDGACDGGGNAGSCQLEPPTFTFSQN